MNKAKQPFHFFQETVKWFSLSSVERATKLRIKVIFEKCGGEQEERWGEVEWGRQTEGSKEGGRER